MVETSSGGRNLRQLTGILAVVNGIIDCHPEDHLRRRCPSCRWEVSWEDEACPHCGHEIPREGFWAGVLAVLVLLGIIGLLGLGCDLIIVWV